MTSSMTNARKARAPERRRGRTTSSMIRLLDYVHRKSRLGCRHRQAGEDLVRIPARSDYAMRAMVAITAADGEYVKAAALADIERIPLEFLQNILRDLRRAGLLEAQRGYDGGYRLARAPHEITLSAVLSAVGSPLTERYEGSGPLWDELETTANGVLASTTLADLAAR